VNPLRPQRRQAVIGTASKGWIAPRPSSHTRAPLFTSIFPSKDFVGESSTSRIGTRTSGEWRPVHRDVCSWAIRQSCAVRIRRRESRRRTGESPVLPVRFRKNLCRDHGSVECSKLIVETRKNVRPFFFTAKSVSPVAHCFQPQERRKGFLRQHYLEQVHGSSTLTRQLSASPSGDLAPRVVRTMRRVGSKSRGRAAFATQGRISISRRSEQSE